MQPKMIMEPTNWWFVDVSFLSFWEHFQVPCSFSGVYKQPSNVGIVI